MAEKDLDFKVILNDEQFNQQISKDIQLAEQFNIQLSALLDLKTKVGKTTMVGDSIKAERLQKATADAAAAQERLRTATINTATAQERNATAAANAANAQERLKMTQMRSEQLAKRIAEQTKKQNNAYLQQSRILNELKRVALGYLSIHGASKLLSSLVRVTGEFELQKTTLAAMIGDLNKAEGIITRIQGLAVESPFQFKELTTYAKQLSAFSVPAEELYNTTKMLADISAGLGVGMDRIVLAYGQVRSAAFLRGQEVRQFTEAGIPILDELAKQFSELEGRVVSTGEVFDKISARLVPFEMVAKVFKDMTSEGGKFYNMQQVQAETLKGKISNLKDAYEMMLNEVGKGQSENLKGAVDWVRKLMTNYEEVGRTLKECIITFGVAKTAIEVLSVATGQLALKNVGLISSLGKVASWVAKNPYVAMGVAITAITVGMHKWVTALSDVEKIQKSVTDSNDKYVSGLASEIAMLDEMYAKLRLAKEGTLEYDQAKARIQSKYSSYIDELKQEGIAVNNLADIYVNLAEKIQKSLMVRSRDEATKNLDVIYGEVVADTQAEFDKLIKASQKAYSISFSTLDKEALRRFVFGGMSKEEVLSVASDELKEYFAKIGETGTLYTLKENMQAALGAYLVGMDDISAAYETLDKVTAQKLEQMATGWRKVVQDTLKSLGLDEGTSFGLWAKDTTKSTDYVEDMIKRYKELKEEIKWVSSFDTEQAERLKKNKNAIEAVARALKIDIKNLAAKDSETTESKEEKRIKRLIESLRQLQDQYEKLKAEGASDESIRTLFKGLYPELVTENGEDFVTDLKYLERASRLVEELEKLNPEAAKKLIVDLGGDQFSQTLKDLKNQNKAYKESAKAAGEYFNALRKWTAEDFNINGEGIAFDVSKITSELNEKINEIELKATKAREIFSQIDLDSEDEITKVKEIFIKEFGADAWGEFWTSYKQKGFKAIRDLAEAQKDAEKVIAQEKARDIGKKYAKELLKEGGVSLSELSDKTYRQLSDMADKIEEQIKHTINELGKIDSEEYDLTEDEKNKILALEEALKELGIEFDKVVDEKSEKFLQNLNEASTLISGVATELAELGKSLDSGFLSELGEQLESVTSGFQSVLNGFIQGGAFGGVVAFLSYGIGTMVNAIEKEINYQDILNEKAREYADIMEEAKRKAFESIAGTNSLGLYEYNTAKLKEAQDRLEESIQKVKDTEKNFFGPNVMFQLNLASMEGGWELYKDNGELNIDAIEAYYDTFAKRLSREEKKLLDELIENSHALTDASLEQAQYLRDIYNDVADSIADAFIDAYKKSGEAALDYSEIMNDIASKLVKDIIKKTLLEQIFTDANILDIASDINNKDIASATQKTEALLKQAENLAPVFEKLFGSVDKYIIREEEQEDSATIGSGIKGVTEDTANLLASYLNAIRADVSYAKGQREQSNAYLQQILTQVSAMNAPSLVEYQQQIAANTFNTAIATQAILSRLDSVITSEGGFDAIRTYS